MIESLTYRQMLDMCNAVKTKEEAAILLGDFVTYYVNKHEYSQDEALKIIGANIGYLAGYCDVETQRRFEHLFGAVHPVFGAVDSPESPKTVEETFQHGLDMGAASRQ